MRRIPSRHPAHRMAILLCFSPWAAAVACQVEAVGVDECRRIEQARCAAARSCDLGIDSADEQATCDRFARDNCLRGFALPDAPKTSLVDACVAAIRTAGTCAGENHPLAKDCPGLGMSSAGTTTTCSVVETPSQAPACAFLVGKPTTSSTGGATGDAAAD